MRYSTASCTSWLKSQAGLYFKTGHIFEAYETSVRPRDNTDASNFQCQLPGTRFVALFQLENFTDHFTLSRMLLKERQDILGHYSK